ncbi:transcriptional regulator NrdR, partial [Candidatus Woesearchaeota archaeon]
MKCPFCTSTETKVIDKRETENEEQTRRRRECLSCQKRFTTYEKVELTNLIVVKKDGLRQQFNKDKILNGVIKSCEKRPVSLDEIHALADEIETDFRNEGKHEITTTEIGEKIIDKLKDLDEIAYVRFASVYREFTDLTSFEKELRNLLKNKKTKKIET